MTASARTARPGLPREVHLRGSTGRACWAVLTVMVAVGLEAGCAPIDRQRAVQDGALVVPNDNRVAAGILDAGVLTLDLEAAVAQWRPDASVDSTVTVFAFSEAGGPPQIPGPLIRVVVGTEVVIRLRNALPDSVRVGLPPPRQATASGVPSTTDGGLIVHGLRAGTVPDDTLHVAAGGEREVRFRADRPGTYHYWGSTSAIELSARGARDSQLTGVIVVESEDVRAEDRDRILVITHLDLFPDSTGPPPYDNVFEVAINGLSWPGTERFQYSLGDTVRWRLVNGSFSEHPMHLHGFHFTILARGDGTSEQVLASDRRPLGVTELLEPGATARIEWVATTPGNWIFHCHLSDHFSPSPAPALEDVALFPLEDRPLRTMAGLVMGISVRDTTSGTRDDPADHHVRLLAQQRSSDGGAVIRSLVVQEGDREPALDSVVVPGAPLILERGRTSAITLVNRMDEPTTIHWHGMELESVYDGIAGWSRTGGSVAPLVEPGDSFVVRMTPPRSGTFIYHTHMGLTDQLKAGMYGPLLVMEPDDTFDPSTDHIFTFGHAVGPDGEFEPVINGSSAPEPALFRAGVTHRIRIINISADLTTEIELVSGETRLEWRRLANDGATLPAALQTVEEAMVRLSAGETYDFEWTPLTGQPTALRVFIPFPTFVGDMTLTQPIEVR